MTLLAAALAVVPSPACADDSPGPAATAPESPGPPLWRVSRGDHELWLFGTLSALPKEMSWRSAAVEHAIASAQEVLTPPGARAAITLRPVQLIRAWARAREMSRNPDDLVLEQVLPPDLYRRWSALRDRYAIRSRLEHQRPIIAAARLYSEAVERHDLVPGRIVLHAIERLAHRADIEPTDTQLHVNPDALLDQAARVPLDAELDCVTKIFDTIERVDEQIAARAHAWARGDLAALRRFEYVDLREECLAFPGWPETLRTTLQAADDKWLAAAEHALQTHRTTFGTVDLRELIAPNGLLERFRERGYEVHEP